MVQKKHRRKVWAALGSDIHSSSSQLASIKTMITSSEAQRKSKTKKTKQQF